MALDFDGFKLNQIINPNMHCTQIIFSAVDNPDIHTKSLILFDSQIKYIQINQHQKFTRVKIYVKWDDESIDIDFSQEQKEMYDLFLKSVYNK